MAKDDEQPKLPRNVALAYLVLKDWATANGYRVTLYKIARGRK